NKLIDLGLNVNIEKGAGAAYSYLDEIDEEAGASIIEDRKQLFSNADILISIQSPPKKDLNNLSDGRILICFLEALQNNEAIEQLKADGITSLGMDAVPRISRAQNMDALSSMSSIAGYKSALIGANK